MVAREGSRFGIIVATLLVVTLTTSTKGVPWMSFRNSLAEPLIIRGGITTIEHFPYQVSLERSRKHVCGGVIVTDTWILTAAHCLYNKGPMSSFRVRVGSSIQVPYVGGEGSVHEIEVLDYHSNYSLKSFDYDIGVIQVKKKFEFSARVQPIPLPNVPEDQFIDYNKPVAVTSGWGVPHTLFTPPSRDLRSVVLPLVPRGKCYRLLKAIKGRRTNDPSVTERMICAGGNGTGATCLGDSGGPLVHKGHVIGLTSWNSRCSERTPNVFTNLMDNEIRAFIRKHIPNL